MRSTGNSSRTGPIKLSESSVHTESNLPDPSCHVCDRLHVPMSIHAQLHQQKADRIADRPDPLGAKSEPWHRESVVRAPLAVHADAAWSEGPLPAPPRPPFPTIFAHDRSPQHAATRTDEALRFPQEAEQYWQQQPAL